MVLADSLVLGDVVEGEEIELPGDVKLSIDVVKA